MYYWIFQFYRKGDQPGVLSDVTEVEVKAENATLAEEEALKLVLLDGRSIRIKAVIVADKK